MSQIIGKWIEDGSINNAKIDSSDTYYMNGLYIDATNALGSIGIGTNNALDPLHIRRTATEASLRLDLDDGGSGRVFQLNSNSSGNFNIRDIGASANRFSINPTGQVGIATDNPVSAMHLFGTPVALTLDNPANRTYQLISDTTGNLQIYDVDSAATRFKISSSGTTTIMGDATVDGNFQVDGTVTVINTEIVITDQLEINQAANEPALIASQDAANTSVVVSVENAGTGPALTTTGNGINVGIGTSNPQAELHVEGDIVGKVTASASNIGSSTRRIGTIYMNSTLDYASDLIFNSTSERVRFTTGGLVGLGTDPGTDTLEINGTQNIWNGTNSLKINGSTVLDLSGTMLRINNGGYTETIINPDGGDVGIGTSDTDERLHVETASGICALKINAQSPSLGQYSSIDLYLSDAQKAQLRALNQPGGGVNIGSVGTGGPVNLTVNGTNEMTIGTSDITIPTNDVGIGASPDSGYTLHVEAPTAMKTKFKSGTSSSVELEFENGALNDLRISSTYNPIGPNTSYFGSPSGSNAPVAFTVNGTNEMFISTGLVEITEKCGIGTASVVDNLHVTDSGSTAAARIHALTPGVGATSDLYFYIGTEKRAELRATQNPFGNTLMRLGTLVSGSELGLIVNNTLEMSIDDSNVTIPTNDVGIGTNVPDERLHAETASGICALKINAQSPSLGQYSSIDLYLSDAQKAQLRALNQPGGGVNIGSVGTGGPVNLTVNGTNEMTISTSDITIPTNDVGIGTNVPDERLHVETASGICALKVNANPALPGQYSGIDLYRSNVQTAQYRTLLGGGVKIGSVGTGGDVQLTVNGTDQMIIGSSVISIPNNSVGIGTATVPGASDLAVFDSGGAQIQVSSGTATGILTAGSDVRVGSTTNSVVRILQNNLSRIIIDTAGNVTTSNNCSVSGAFSSGNANISGTLNTSGVVGIGTAVVPGATDLAVFDSAGAQIQVSNGTATGILTATGSEVRVGSTTNSVVRFYQNGSSRMFIDTSGDVTVVGNLSKGGGSFLIDHPLDPDNKILRHSFVESPEMRNVYYGQAETENYKSVIKLPEWWQALNGYEKNEYSYQLTSIGTFSRLFISKEIEDNEFEVSSLDESVCKFSWVISGIRHDKYAEENPIIVEEEKPENKKGISVNSGEYIQ